MALSYEPYTAVAAALQNPWPQAWNAGFARLDSHAHAHAAAHWANVSADWKHIGAAHQLHASGDWYRQRQQWPKPWERDAAERTIGELDASSSWPTAGQFTSVLPEEPRELLLVNSESCGAYAFLCRDSAEADVVAFDAEWRPDWNCGSDNPISVLQLAFPSSSRVYVLQLGKLGNKLPQDVQMMLVNPEVTKVGFAVGSDSHKFAKSNIQLMRGSVVDVQAGCASAVRLHTLPGALSLKRAANVVLGYNLVKDKRCSCSDWASEKLTAEQIRYAAFDAWVALRLYYAIGCW